MSTEEQQSSSATSPTGKKTAAASHPSPVVSMEVTVSDVPARSDSPSPSVTPSIALDAIPVLDRSVSTPSSSTASTLSSRSRHSRLSDGGASVIKRRGYMRPQGTAFADSARNRDSVMSLGSIAHMQYYFARTGLLDGKGAQLARGVRKKSSSAYLGDKENMEPQPQQRSLSQGAVGREDFSLGSLSLTDGSSAYAVSDPGIDASGQEHGLVESPTELSSVNPEHWIDTVDPIMLPPTVSTYKLKPEYTEPVPDLPVLRRELKEALQDACKVLEESQKEENTGGNTATGAANSSSSGTSSAGFYELQGLHMLDITTLAIRAAKNYYTAHPNPQRLYAIKSERAIRAELYQVLDILKRMASRNFRGGIRITELTEIITWIESIDKMLKKEELQEQTEAAERETWVWREGDWSGREREREWLFLKSFDPCVVAAASSADDGSVKQEASAPLPAWRDDDPTVPTAFLRALQDGQRLVRLHNALVARSKRRFAEIKTWHTDVAKPYRMAENLQFWCKAAELRWDLHLDIPALDVVYGIEESAWRKFDQAVLQWCQGVRQELTEEWVMEALSAERKRPPELKVDVADEHDANATIIAGGVTSTTAASINPGPSDTPIAVPVSTSGVTV